MYMRARNAWIFAICPLTHEPVHNPSKLEQASSVWPSNFLSFNWFRMSGGLPDISRIDEKPTFRLKKTTSDLSFMRRARPRTTCVRIKIIARHLYWASAYSVTMFFLTKSVAEQDVLFRTVLHLEKLRGPAPLPSRHQPAHLIGVLKKLQKLVKSLRLCSRFMGARAGFNNLFVHHLRCFQFCCWKLIPWLCVNFFKLGTLFKDVNAMTNGVDKLLDKLRDRQ